jgi:hypothetical protein
MMVSSASATMASAALKDLFIPVSPDYRRVYCNAWFADASPNYDAGCA